MQPIMSAVRYINFCISLSDYRKQLIYSTLSGNMELRKYIVNTTGLERTHEKMI